MDGTKSPSKSLPVSQQDTTTSSTPPTTTTTTGRSKTNVHVTALDGIVTVNSLFTVAVFIGFSLTVPAAGGARSSCIASMELVRKIIVYEIISFSCFLFSSLIAQSLKLAINLANSLNSDNPHRADVDSFCMKYGSLGSAIGSVLGCLFLMLSIVDFIQVKLGLFDCGGKSVIAVTTLVVLVGSSLFVYILTAVYAFCFM